MRKGITYNERSLSNQALLTGKTRKSEYIKYSRNPIKFLLDKVKAEINRSRRFYSFIFLKIILPGFYF